MKISHKFSGAVILLLLASLGGAAWLLARQQDQIIYEQVQARAQSVLDFGESCREYARNTLSPAVHREFDRPGKKAPLVFEADSATFVARGTFELLKKRSKEYTFREAALNPLNRDNLADEKERLLIEQFQADPALPDLRGFRVQDDVEQFYMARPIVVEAKCLACHHAPDTAPPELVARYGSEHGYGWKVGEINSVLIVTVPSADIRAHQAGLRWRLLTVFIVLAVLLAVAVPFLFEQLVNRRLRRAGRVMEEIRGDLLDGRADSSMEGPVSPPPVADAIRTPLPSASEPTPPHGVELHRLADYRLPVENHDELGVLAATFNRMADAVRDSHQFLEDRVRRRTKELSRSNQALERTKRQLEENAHQLSESLKNLRQSEARAHTILQAATQVSVIATDPTGTITDFNTGAEHMLGYRAEEMVGKHTPEVIHERSEVEDYGQLLSVEFGRTIRGFEAFVERARHAGHDERDWTYIRKDGSRLPVRLSVTARHDLDGRLTGYLGIAIDVTEQKRAEEMLLRAKVAAEAASQAKSDFLANMSHEIRTPMSGILGMTELALDTELTSEQREYLDMVKSSADALMSVINDVLDFSKIEAGRLNVESVEFGLRDAIAETMKPLDQRARGKGLTLSTRIAPEVPDALIGDPGRLRQILLNLVGNAIKFTERGSVAVECGIENAEGNSAGGGKCDLPPSGFCLLQFSVTDTGIGIPENKLAAVFEPFVQADTSTTRRYGGTGLGLTITSRLVEMMGGRVWAESEVGKGSCFHFSVRLGLSAAVVPATTTARSETSAITADSGVVRGPLRILLAEDNPVNQRLAVGLLAKQGHEVIVVNDGAAAVQAVRSDRFDVVLMDVHMPEMGGFEATAAIRELEKGTGRHLPILAITARALKGDREKCLGAGMDGYLSKPVQGWQLYQAIAELRRGAQLAAQTGSEASNGESSFDPATVLQRLNGDRPLLREMIAIFQKSGPKLLSQLRAALDAGDAARVRQLIHTLKGSVCNFGAEEVLRALEQLDKARRISDSAGERSALNELVSGFDRLLADLHRWTVGD